MYNSPKVYPVCWGDKFKMKKPKKTLYMGVKYEVIGIGSKTINETKYECLLISDGNSEQLIPKETIEVLFNNNYIQKL